MGWERGPCVFSYPPGPQRVDNSVHLITEGKLLTGGEQHGRNTWYKAARNSKATLEKLHRQLQLSD